MIVKGLLLKSVFAGLKNVHCVPSSCVGLTHIYSLQFGEYVMAYLFGRGWPVWVLSIVILALGGACSTEVRLGLSRADAKIVLVSKTLGLALVCALTQRPWGIV